MQFLTHQLRFFVFCPIDMYSHMQNEALFGMQTIGINVNILSQDNQFSFTLWGF